MSIEENEEKKDSFAITIFRWLILVPVLIGVKYLIV